MSSRIIYTPLLIITFLFFAHANEQNINNSQKEQALILNQLEKNPNQFILVVNGLCCKSCAIGIGKKVSKVQCVDTKALPKGIKIDRQNSLLKVAIKPDQPLDLDAIYKAIRHAGYDPVTLYRLNSDKSLEIVKVPFSHE